MLAAKQDGLEDGLKATAVHLDECLHAVANDRFHQLEVAVSELREAAVVIADHVQGGLQELL